MYSLSVRKLAEYEHNEWDCFLAQSCGVSLHKPQTSEVMSRRTECEPMSADR